MTSIRENEFSFRAERVRESIRSGDTKAVEANLRRLEEAGQALISYVQNQAGNRAILLEKLADETLGYAGIYRVSRPAGQLLPKGTGD